MAGVLIAGCGYVGSRLAELLVADGRRVIGLKRDPSTLPTGVEPVAADVSDPRSLAALPSDLSALVYAVAPSGRTEADYRAAYVDGLGHLLAALRDRGGMPARAVLVTSTGVYGHTDGRWVDEETDPEPADPTGATMLEAEAALRDADITGIALRLGGIYGPGRDATVRRVLDGQARCPDEGRYGNRIHRDDAAGALRHLLDLPDPAALYIGVDRDPAPLREVYRWIARRAGVADPCQGAAESWEASGRRGTNKRCSSDRLAASGYLFRYPSFREGYTPLVPSS